MTLDARDVAELSDARAALEHLLGWLERLAQDAEAGQAIRGRLELLKWQIAGLATILAGRREIDMRSGFRTFTATVLLLLVAVMASAQVPAPKAPGMLRQATAREVVAINPTTVVFDASVDHGTIVEGTTTEVVTSYQLLIYLASDTTTAVLTYDLGKPTPTSGAITIVNAAYFAALNKHKKALAKVAAIGPGGTGLSEASNPFAMLGAPTAAGAPVVK